MERERGRSRLFVAQRRLRRFLAWCEQTNSQSGIWTQVREAKPAGVSLGEDHGHQAIQALGMGGVMSNSTAKLRNVIL